MYIGIRKHMKECIQDVYKNITDISLSTSPNDDSCDPLAYRTALIDFNAGDVAIIFTPDDTHFDIAMACIERGLHVLITKPVVMNLEHHNILANAAKQRNVLVAVEVHKRWDPIYVDARDRIQQHLGTFSYIYSYMSQPKYQLETFKAWAGKSSDISYYLNSHHIDFHEWCVGDQGRPVSVTAVASTGVAEQVLNRSCEDTITLTVQWEMFPTDTTPSSSLGTAIYTSSWIAPKSDVHSQQRFFYMGQRGETTVDQAHRGYNTAADANRNGASSDPVSEAAGGVGLRSVNPLFMKYTPSRNGKFAGQSGYGYRSFEMFILGVQNIKKGDNTPLDFNDDNENSDSSLATIHCTYRTTAILEAGRMSLDNNRTIKIVYDEHSKKSVQPIGLEIV